MIATIRKPKLEVRLAQSVQVVGVLPKTQNISVHFAHKQAVAAVLSRAKIEGVVRD